MSLKNDLKNAFDFRSAAKNEINTRVDDAIYGVANKVSQALTGQDLLRGGKSGFSSVNNEILTKRYLTSQDGYVSGYFFTAIDEIPLGLSAYLKSNYSSDAIKKVGWDDETIRQTFSSFAADVQLPQDTLRSVSFQGRSGFAQNSPIFTQKGNTISISFLVDQNLLITRLISGWYEYITRLADGRADIESGGGGGIIDTIINKATSFAGLGNILGGGSGSDYKAQIYSSTIYYCTMLPNGNDVNFAFVGTGIYPTMNPISDFNGTLGTVENIKHNVTFNVDYYDIWVPGKSETQWIKDYMQELVTYYRAGIFGSGNKGYLQQIADRLISNNLGRIGDAITSRIKGPAGEIISGGLTSVLKEKINTAASKGDSRINKASSRFKMKSANTINKIFKKF